jgi:nucleoside-diphosphate-sugar epimerase
VRILVIGGTGLTGPHTVRRLSELGHEIVVFHRGDTEAELPRGVGHIHGDRKDLSDFAAEFARFAPRIVVDMIPRNAQDAWSVVAAFKDIAQRVVALSSQDVYRAYGVLRGRESGPIEPIPLTEDSPLRTNLNPYYVQTEGSNHIVHHYEKILAEQIYRANPGLPGTILRFPMVYGPRDLRQHRLFEYLKRMQDGRPAILLEEGLAGWRWTKGYAENLATATVLAVTDERATGRTYNVGEPDALTWAEWVRAIGRAAGWDGAIVTLPRDRLPGYLRSDDNTGQHLVVDSTRIRQELGYREVVARGEALRRTVSWERGHPPEAFDPERFDYAAEDALLAALGE